MTLEVLCKSVSMNSLGCNTDSVAYGQKKRERESFNQLSERNVR